MKVLLINPAAENTLLANNPAIIDEERGLNPPLGLLYVAAYLEKYSNHTVNVLDAQAELMDCAEIERFIRTAKPDVVGLTAMTFTLLDVLKIVGIVKGIDTNIKTVLGGPHPYLYPENTISLDGVDFLVLGREK
jgi:anaerobic magnesium-protoporphyrin IX monomethyl ester cyclase